MIKGRCPVTSTALSREPCLQLGELGAASCVMHDVSMVYPLLLRPLGNLSGNREIRS